VAADGTVLIDLDHMRRLLAAGGAPERIWHSWIHESLHARRPATTYRAEEVERWMGYEEGLVEGLPRVVEQRAGIAVGDLPFEFYVAAYRALAEAAGIELERLLRGLWRLAPGDVRAHLSDVVSELRAPTRVPLTPAGIIRIGATGARVLSSRRSSDPPDSTVLVRLWEAAFRRDRRTPPLSSP
jgi:hypothetical protein